MWLRASFLLAALTGRIEPLSSSYTTLTARSRFSFSSSNSPIRLTSIVLSHPLGSLSSSLTKRRRSSSCVSSSPKKYLATAREKQPPPSWTVS